VVEAIFVSACVAAYESILRLIHPSAPSHLLILVLAGAIGFTGNWLAALVRTRAGHRLESPALIADGNHARVDAYVSLAVIASAVAIAAGAPILDPLIGLGMTVASGGLVGWVWVLGCVVERFEQPDVGEVLWPPGGALHL
jgi:divalent metal cation (Fe/Co/Zn/Cd) transporter